MNKRKFLILVLSLIFLSCTTVTRMFEEPTPTQAAQPVIIATNDIVVIPTATTLVEEVQETNAPFPDVILPYDDPDTIFDINITNGKEMRISLSGECGEAFNIEVKSFPHVFEEHTDMEKVFSAFYPQTGNNSLNWVYSNGDVMSFTHSAYSAVATKLPAENLRFFIEGEYFAPINRTLETIQQKLECLRKSEVTISQGEIAKSLKIVGIERYSPYDLQSFAENFQSDKNLLGQENFYLVFCGWKTNFENANTDPYSWSRYVIHFQEIQQSRIELKTKYP